MHHTTVVLTARRGGQRISFSLIRYIIKRTWQGISERGEDKRKNLRQNIKRIYCCIPQAKACKSVVDEEREETRKSKMRILCNWQKEDCFRFYHIHTEVLRHTQCLEENRKEFVLFYRLINQNRSLLELSLFSFLLRKLVWADDKGKELKKNHTRHWTSLRKCKNYLNLWIKRKGKSRIVKEREKWRIFKQ